MEVICITHNWMRWCQNFSFVVVLWWLMARPKGWGLHGNGTLRSFQSVAFAAPSKPSLIFKTSGNRSFASLEKRRTEVRTSNEVISHRSSFIEGKSLLRTLMVDAVAMRIIAYLVKVNCQAIKLETCTNCSKTSPPPSMCLETRRYFQRGLSVFCKPPEKKVHISTFLLWPAHILDLYPPSPPSSKLLSLCWHKIETSLIFQKQRILTRHPLLVRRRKYNLSKLIFWHTPSQVKRKAALKSFHMDFLWV